jgi:hypothetical protein
MSKLGTGILGAILSLSLLACGEEESTSPKCTVAPGDFIITEFMANPKGPDDYKEYIEIYNPTDKQINLEGVRLFTAKADLSGSKTKGRIADKITLDPGQYFVLGDVEKETDGPSYIDYAFSSKLALPNSNSGIGFLCGTTQIDFVAYESLKESQAQIRNDDGWCAIPKEERYIIPELSTEEAVNYGTPGASNPSCGIISNCNGLQEGDFIITEVLPNPQGTDGFKEYVEIQNTTQRTLDLTGVKLFWSKLDLSGEQAKWSISQGTIEPGGYFVAGDYAATESDPLPAHLDYGFSTALSIPNGEGRVGFYCGETIIDEMTYSGNKEGQSHSRNADTGDWCLTPVDEAYAISTLIATNEKTTYGTPGTDNAATTCDQPSTCDSLDPGYCFTDENCNSREIVMPEEGALLITEIMIKPNGEGAAQWFEVYAKSAFDLNGLIIKKGTASTKYTIKSDKCLSMSADSYALIATKADGRLENGMVVIPSGSLSLNASSNRNVSLYDSDENLIESYDYSTPSQGVSLQLNSAKFSSNPVDIDDSSDYCVSTETYGTEGDLGTPGMMNSVCSGPTPAACMNIPAGALIFTEIMANPNGGGGSDNGKEYVEIRNTTAESIDLEGVRFFKSNTEGASAKTWVFGPTTVFPGQHFVFGDGSASSLTHLDYGFDTSDFLFNNTAGKIGLYCGTAAEITAGTAHQIDAIVYTDVKDGQALILTGSPANWCNIDKDPLFNIDTLSANDYGTPGHDGGTCM